MISAVSYANELVHKLSQEHEEYSNMGSTFIACCIDNKSAYIDSCRCIQDYIFIEMANLIRLQMTIH